MEKYIEFIYNSWKQFTEHGILNCKVKPEIADSWRRCKEYGVNHLAGCGSDKYKVPVEIKARENAELISVARPIMEYVYNIVRDSGFAIILTDKDGYLIDVIGDSDVMKRANELNFVKGALWSEEAVGTNAIGTALYMDKPIQTIGAEHYAVMHHSWTCSAAPIHDEEGNILGCINMSGTCCKAHSHTLGIVTAAAQSIQKQLALAMSYKLLNITFDSVSEGMIVLDDKLNIKRVNNRAISILGLTPEEALKINIGEILRNIDVYNIMNPSGKPYNNIECNFYIKSDIIKCIANIIPMNVTNKLVGVVITFSETQYVHKLVNKVVGYKASYTFDDFITVNNRMKEIINFAEKAAKSDCNILIEGESGTGKEVIAQSIHNCSKRSGGPFVAVNCASIPRELVESELFGYDKGAFTGANKEGHPGKFELADGGTIFLDEVGELPLDIQTKLLRVLDNNKIVRVGGYYEKQLNVRVIGATNRVLREEIKKKNFREDLYYRLNVMNIKTIPLRERKEDIDALVHKFVEKLNAKNYGEHKDTSPDYIEHLKQYDWHGNVRELRNVVERDYYLSREKIAFTKYIKHDVENDLVDANENFIKPLSVIEKENIEKALEGCKGNTAAAARMLNIGRATLYRKMKKYNIEK